MSSELERIGVDAITPQLRRLTIEDHDVRVVAPTAIAAVFVAFERHGYTVCKLELAGWSDTNGKLVDPSTHGVAKLTTYTEPVFRRVDSEDNQ